MQKMKNLKFRIKKIEFFCLLAACLLFSFKAWSASHHPQDFLEKVAGKKDEGQQIVDHFCSICHGPEPRVLVGAPQKGELKDWEPRFKQGMDVLMAHTCEGIRGMPPRGGCFECSDEQLLAALLVLLPPSLAEAAEKSGKSP